jgi:hypothetical protein
MHISKPLAPAGWSRWAIVVSFGLASLRGQGAAGLRGTVSDPSGATMPTAALTYELAGPANGKPSWFSLDNNNFGPQRRIVKNGFGWDFNYALSHSIDNGSAAESGAANGGAVLQDSFNPRAFRGSSDFDIRHNVTANGIYELPFGKGEKLLSGANALVDQIVGGWQLSSLVRYRSGLPTTINFCDVWPTNYVKSAIGIVAYEQVAPENVAGFNAAGNPSAFTAAPGTAVKGLAAPTGPAPSGSSSRSLARARCNSRYATSSDSSRAIPGRSSHGRGTLPGV